MKLVVLIYLFGITAAKDLRTDTTTSDPDITTTSDPDVTTTSDPDTHSTLCVPNLDCTSANLLDKVPDPTSCLRYYICVNVDNSIIASDSSFKCPQNQSFDSEIRECILRVEPYCYNTCANHCNMVCTPESEKTSVAFPGETDRYNYCIGGSPVPLFCPDSHPYFDGNTCVSDSLAVCDFCSHHCPQAGVQVADPYDCRRFYICTEEGNPSWHLRGSCQSGQYFDPTFGGCVNGNMCTDICPLSGTDTTTLSTTIESDTTTTTPQTTTKPDSTTAESATTTVEITTKPDITTTTAESVITIVEATTKPDITTTTAESVTTTVETTTKPDITTTTGESVTTTVEATTKQDITTTTAESVTTTVETTTKPDITTTTGESVTTTVEATTKPDITTTTSEITTTPESTTRRFPPIFPTEDTTTSESTTRRFPPIIPTEDTTTSEGTTRRFPPIFPTEDTTTSESTTGRLPPIFPNNKHHNSVLEVRLH